jgi:hypothetical protein
VSCPIVAASTVEVLAAGETSMSVDLVPLATRSRVVVAGEPYSSWEATLSVGE